MIKLVFTNNIDRKSRQDPSKTRQIVKKNTILFLIPSRNSFNLLMRKLKTYTFIKLFCYSFDAFESRLPFSSQPKPIFPPVKSMVSTPQKRIPDYSEYNVFQTLSSFWKNKKV